MKILPKLLRLLLGQRAGGVPDPDADAKAALEVANRVGAAAGRQPYAWEDLSPNNREQFREIARALRRRFESEHASTA